MRKTISFYIYVEVCIFAVMLMGNGELLAKSKPELNDISEYSLSDLLNVKVQVASKSEETVEEAPSSVTVFTAADIQNMGISNIEELLNFAPGFQTTLDIEQGTANRISSRGRTTALSESILFLINGQRLNDLYTGGISIINRLIAVENIKQVEIIRGPGSALYGSNAFLGVVNIVTETDKNNVTVKVGNMNSRDIAINFSKKISNSLNISAFAKAFSDNGYNYKNITDVFGQTGDTHDPVKGMDAFLTLKFKNLTIDARHMERSREDFLVFGGLANHINTEKTRQSYISSNYSGNIGKNLKIDMGASYMEDHWNALALVLPEGTEVAPGFIIMNPGYSGPFLNSNNLNIHADFTYNFSRINATLIGGISYMRTGITHVANLFNYDPVSLEYMGNITEFEGEDSFNNEIYRNVFGIYVQGKIVPVKRLTITGGLRYDHYKDFGGTLNPRAAIIYNMPFGGKLKAMFGGAFRAPNFLELYDKNNPVDFGNADLNPEKINTFEFAYIHNFKKAQLVLTYFHNDIDNMIILGQIPYNPSNILGVPGFYNYEGEGGTSGLEFEFKYSPIKSLMVYGTYTHMLHLTNEDVSHNFASLVLNYTMKKWNVNLKGIFRDKIKNLPSQESYTLIDGTVYYQLTTGLKLLGIVKNIFDTQYLTISHTMVDGVPNRGRTFAFGIQAAF